ncbi:rRNA maturation RNase YbeY [Sulfurimonas sp.]
MIELDNTTSLQVQQEYLQSIADMLTDKDIELIITTNEAIQKLNSEHRGIDMPTDVLSFPYEEMPMAPLGSIVISREYVKQMATKFKHKEEDELALLFIHGLLHLLGYDHEVDNGEMRKKEADIIATLHLPKSLIVRTQG